jgi:hypothetical protein
MTRIQSFEFNDAPWAPAALRETIVEALSRALEWGGVVRALAPPFRDFLQRTGADEVLDLCSGAGGPAAILAGELARNGERAPRFLLTDLQPHPETWTRLRDAHPGVIDFVPQPVDATRIPPHLGGQRARVIINALHHFPPHLAGAILLGACAGAPGVFVAESFERNPLRLAPLAPAGLPALFATPLLSPRRRLQKALLTWFTPIVAAASLWDGVISTLRVYNERELREMVAPAGNAFEWTWGTYSFPVFGRGYYFHGVRR